MRIITIILLAAFLIAGALFAAEDPKTDVQQPTTPVDQIQHGPCFVDLNGDGFNDNAPDADGDGIPNGVDPDWVRPQDGTGSMMRGGMGSGMGMHRHNMRDNAMWRNGGANDGNVSSQMMHRRMRDGSCDGPGQRMRHGHRTGGGNG